MRWCFVANQLPFYVYPSKDRISSRSLIVGHDKEYSSLTSRPFKKDCWEEGQEHQNVKSSLLALKNFFGAVYFCNRPCCNVFSTIPSLLGASVFLRPEFSTAIHGIDDNSFQKWNGISNDAAKQYTTRFDLNTELPFKILQIHTFNTENPFKEMPNTNVIRLINETTSTTEQKYYVQVIVIQSTYIYPFS